MKNLSISEMKKINGKVVKIEDLTAFSDIAPAFVFGQDNNFPIDLYAVKPSKILYIPKNELLKIIQSNVKIFNNEQTIEVKKIIVSK